MNDEIKQFKKTNDSKQRSWSECLILYGCEEKKSKEDTDNIMKDVQQIAN